MSAALVETRGLKKYFKVPSGFLHAVDDVSFKIASGGTLGVVGESGCGKSTLGRVMLKLIEPTDGQVLFDGVDITKYTKKQMKKYCTEMQIIFQDPYSSLNPRMTVIELISEPLIVNGIYPSNAEIQKRVRKMMDMVGLASRLEMAYPHELDGGRRQRIGIARALSLNPRFIVCDEPVSALDVSIQAQILNLLMDLQDSLNLTYLFITHNLSIVKHISDDIAVMYLGKCVEFATEDEIFENPRHPYTKALLRAIPMPDLSVRLDKSQIIRGEVTSPVNPKSGCRFAARCEFRIDACTAGNISEVEISPTHYVSCVRAPEL
ncbi:MAG: ATP-binding cassette domain-containing protein [Synergistaceae bacterium]|nr:ATP-binding cassette domain-containing protein [Synergistaceae bacterium]